MYASHYLSYQRGMEAILAICTLGIVLCGFNPEGYNSGAQPRFAFHIWIHTTGSGDGVPA